MKEHEVSQQMAASCLPAAVLAGMSWSPGSATPATVLGADACQTSGCRQGFSAGSQQTCNCLNFVT